MGASSREGGAVIDGDDVVSVPVGVRARVAPRVAIPIVEQEVEDVEVRQLSGQLDAVEVAGVAGRRVSAAASRVEDRAEHVFDLHRCQRHPARVAVDEEVPVVGELDAELPILRHPRFGRAVEPAFVALFEPDQVGVAAVEVSDRPRIVAAVQLEHPRAGDANLVVVGDLEAAMDQRAEPVGGDLAARAGLIAELCRLERANRGVPGHQTEGEGAAAAQPADPVDGGVELASAAVRREEDVVLGPRGVPEASHCRSVGGHA